jgi:hypothetical protein
MKEDAMKKLPAVLGHAAAVLAVVLAAIAPFVLFGGFTRAIGSLGLRIHPGYSGGEVARAISRPGYRVLIFQPVGRTTPLQRIQPFVQVQWTPASSLPPALSEDLDLDGDGKPDMRVALRPAELTLDAVPLDPRYRPARLKGVGSFSALVARVGDAVVARLPFP